MKIKQMVYGGREKTEVLCEGRYKNHKFAILSLGTHPTAYVENKLNITNYNDFRLKNVEVHLTHLIGGQIETDKDKEIARLTDENAELKARLEKAVISPCKVGDEIYYLRYFCDYKKCDDTTQQFCCGCKEMIERERRNEKYVICGKPFELKDLNKIGKKYFITYKEAEARLAELKEE